MRTMVSIAYFRKPKAYFHDNAHTSVPSSSKNAAASLRTAREGATLLLYQSAIEVIIGRPRHAWRAASPVLALTCDVQALPRTGAIHEHYTSLQVILRNFKYSMEVEKSKPSPSLQVN